MPGVKWLHQTREFRYNQQSSMTEIDEGAYSQSAEAASVEKPVAKEVVKPVKVQPKPVVVEAKPVISQPSKPAAEAKSAEPQEELKERLARIEVEDIVYHKKFGKGEVVKINKNERFIFVKFMLGEKKFMFPDAFLMGFLEV